MAGAGTGGGRRAASRRHSAATWLASSLVLLPLLGLMRTMAPAAWVQGARPGAQLRSPSPTQREVEVSRASFGQGMMLFDFGAYGKERFMMETIFDLVKVGPEEIKG